MSAAFPDPGFVDTNGIRMAVYEAGSGPAIILLHGFPELAFSWRHQLPALAAAGFWAVAPDLRGYGRTDKPADVGAYRIEELIDDIAGLLAALGLDRAVFVAHDWGALLAWQMALLRPELMRGLIALNIPFYARSDDEPIAAMRARFGDDFYIVDFQDSDGADCLFAADPGRFINLMMRRGQITRQRFESLPAHKRALNLKNVAARASSSGEPLLTDTELRYYAQAFAAGGFSGPINWYRNWTHNWSITEGVAQTVHVPALFIGAEDDVVVSPTQIEAMRPHVTDLEIEMIKQCGHWTQQEQPERTNALMLDWLARRYPP